VQAIDGPDHRLALRGEDVGRRDDAAPVSATTSKPLSRMVGASFPPTYTGSAVETASTPETWSSNSHAPEMPAVTEPERMGRLASPPPE
jgi:hypothetical protein